MALTATQRKAHRIAKARYRTGRLAVRSRQEHRVALMRLEIDWARVYGLEPEPLSGALPEAESPVLRDPAE